MTLKEEALISMIKEYLAKHDVLVSTQKFLATLASVIAVPFSDEEIGLLEEVGKQSPETTKLLAEQKKAMDEGRFDEAPIQPAVVESAQSKIISISCDASIKKNPGGPSSVGVIIRQPDQKESIQIAMVTKATTNNQAEYDAIYTGLITLLNISNRPKYPVTIYSDSQLVINQLRKKSTCNDKSLQKRRDMILATAAEIEAGVTFEWRPRNSTEDLKNANYLAQDKLNVKRH